MIVNANLEYVMYVQAQIWMPDHESRRNLTTVYRVRSREECIIVYMQYARLRCNLSRAVGPVGIKGKLSVTVSIICNYAPPIPDLASIAREGNEQEKRSATIICTCRVKKKVVSDSALLLGSGAELRDSKSVRRKDR